MSQHLPGRVQTEDKSFARDMHSKALLNTDTQALERHRAARRKASDHHRLEREVAELRAQVARLTELIEKALN